VAASDSRLPLAHDGRPFDVPTNFDFESTDVDSTDLPMKSVGC
jgi:hypothetical protein